jgi:DNA-binding beta-propeller fold protein YncE
MLLTLATAFLAATAPPPPGKPKSVTILVLDDSDREFQGKEKYEDNLTAYTTAGDLKFRTDGINMAQSIGGSNTIVPDMKREHIWVVESAGNHLLRFDAEGKKVLTVDDVHGYGGALDPETGNVWVTTGKRGFGTGDVVVYNPAGKVVASHGVGGYDIAYDPKGKAFWVAHQQLTKLGLDGKVLFQTEISKWTASSVAVNPESGQVWVTAREHPQVQGSTNRLLGYANDGKKLFDHDVTAPFKVSVDPQTGDGWVTVFGKGLRRYGADGTSKGEVAVPGALGAVAPGVDGDVWVVTREETVRLTAAGKKVLAVKHKKPTDQAWIGWY